MNQTHSRLNSSVFCFFAAVAFCLPAAAAEISAAPAGVLWRDPGDVRALNLVYGSGGREHQPSGTYTFVEEDKQGTAPKFEVTDENGVRWKVKLGEETRSETAASRLVWAAGYFTDEDYFLPEIHVGKMPRLHRGQNFVSADGAVRDVRMERKVEGQKKDGNWSWFRSPPSAGREADGLRVMMVLLNNWDLKQINNAIYEEKGEAPRYVVSDLGATFGRTGNPLVRSKSNLKDYRNSKFIQHAGPEMVDFHLNSRPFFPAVIDLPNYITRTRMQLIAKHVPREHARWIGELLGRLSAEQIRDCFRTAGYSPEEVEGYAGVVEKRIADLNRL